MTREELALVLGAADRFVRKELGPHLAALDLDPRSARVDAVEALRGVGFLPSPDLDDELLAPPNALALLSTVSAHCAGIGALVAYALAGEHLRRRGAPDVTARPVAIALYEQAAPELEEARMGFETVLSNGMVTGHKRSVRLADCAQLFAVFACGPDGDPTGVGAAG